jgi:hypothetical protein
MESQFLRGSHTLVCEFEGTFENSKFFNSVATGEMIFTGMLVKIKE